MEKQFYQIICLRGGVFDSVIQGLYLKSETDELIKILTDEDRVMMREVYTYKTVLFFDSKYPLAK